MSARRAGSSGALARRAESDGRGRWLIASRCAVQGDGEISLTALETPMQEVLIQVVLYKQKKFQWPHHVARRGNRREPVFFGPEDYRLYRRLIATATSRADAEIWAYCLMPNHVHLIVTPADEDGLRATLPKRTAVPPGPSTRGSTGRAIYSRAASVRW